MPILVVGMTLLAGPLRAQTTPASSKAACKIDKSDPSDADLAFFHRDFKKAEALYAAAYAKDPTDSRNRELQIDSVIGQGKLDDARKLTDEWTASETKDPFAILTAADMRYAEGDWLESYALNLKALKMNPCIADGYEGLADYEELAGFRATAQRHRTMAHQLAPNNPHFWMHWIESLGEAQRDVETRNFIANNKVLDDKQRAGATRALDRSMAMSENRCELVSSTGPAVIPMQPVYGRGMDVNYYGLEISFNGHKRTLQIDTGASGFLLTHSAGASIGLPSAIKTRVGGFGDQGANDTELTHAASVRIGGLEFRNCAVEVLSNYGVMGGSHLEGNRIDSTEGLVGSDIFSRYLVTLDYVKHEIRLEPLPQAAGSTTPASQLDPLGGSNDPDWMNVDRFIGPAMQNWTKIYRRGHQLIMPTRINGTTPRLFVVDTGSFTNLIDLKTAAEVTQARSGMGKIRGLSGTSDLSEAGSFTLDFAGLRLPVKSMDSMDLTHMGSGLSGFIGYPTLQQLVMHLDYRDNLVLFEAPSVKK